MMTGDDSLIVSVPPEHTAESGTLAPDGLGSDGLSLRYGNGFVQSNPASEAHAVLHTSSLGHTFDSW